MSLAGATCNQPTHTRLSNGIVGLRGALLKGNQARLFAECAIVAHSDPACEYDETCIKLAGMRAALKR
ncbi:chorismate-binding protein [Pseudomonas sp. LF135]